MNAMIDLETMGKTGQAAILSIGIAIFNESGIKNKFYHKIDLQSCIDVGLKIDASTLIWWLQQSEQARKEFYSEKEGFDIQTSLIYINKFLSEYEDIKVWGNGANFDISILENAFNVCGIDVPWKHNNVRCFRTYKAMSPQIISIPEDRPAHNALEDAIWQAEYAIEIMNQRFI